MSIVEFIKKVLVVVTLINTTNITVGDYVFPYWTFVIGQMLTASIMLGIVAYAVYAIVHALITRKVYIFDI